MGNGVIESDVFQFMHDAVLHHISMSFVHKHPSGRKEGTMMVYTRHFLDPIMMACHSDFGS